MLNKRGLVVRLLIYVIILVVVGSSLYSIYQRYAGGIDSRVILNQEDKSSNNVVEDISVGGDAKSNEQTTDSKIGEVEKNSVKIGNNSTNGSEGNQTYYIQPLSKNKIKAKLNNSLKI